MILAAKISMLMCLGVSLSVAGDKLSLWAKMGVVGTAWLAVSCANTLSIIAKTFVRDMTIVYRLVSLLLMVKWAQFRNLTLPKMFYQSFRKFPDRVLFYYKDEEWTFRNVEEYSNRIAHYFLSEGYTKGDTVGVLMSSRPEFVCVWLGLSKIGVLPALINHNLKADSLMHSITVAKCKALIFSSELAQAVETVVDQLCSSSMDPFPTYTFSSSVADSVHGCKDLQTGMAAVSKDPVDKDVQDSINFSDKLMYIYTSGTTGLPKAAVIKHSRYIMAGGGLTCMMAISTKDRVYCPLPLYHSVGGMISLSGCMRKGISMVIRDKFSARAYWEDCVKYKVTAAQYIGELCRYLLNTPECEYEKQHCVRIMFGNGLRPQIWSEFVNRFNIPDIAEFYGSTEGNSQLINFDNRVGAVGFLPVWLSPVLPMGPIRIDQDGNPIRDTRTGLCIRCDVDEPGEFVGVIQEKNPIREFMGYSDSASTKKKIVRDVFKKGDLCFRSGDILVKDELGYLYFKDRTGDTYRWKGENVSTTEVEGIISRSADMVDVVVYGVLVPGCEGRIGMAAIVDKEDDLDLVKLHVDLKRKLPGYAQPAFLRLVNELDITGTFKLKKRSLQAQGYILPENSDDRIYMLHEDNYVPLSQDLLERIETGEIRF